MLVHTQDCENVTLRGLTIDYNPLTYIQADIIGSSASEDSSSSWQLKLVDRSLNWSVVDGRLGGIGGAMLWKPEGPGMEKWVAGSGGRPSPDQVQQVPGQPNVFKTLSGFPMPANAAVGDSLTYMLRQAHTVAIGNSSKVVMEDVTTLTTLGLNFYELDGDGGHTYRRINVTRAPGYMIGSNADGFHSIDVGTGPHIVDSEISYTLDDIFNIHNTIHLLFPRNGSASESTSTGADEAVLVNPRIWCGGKAGYNFNASTENKHPLDLDLWYGDTSPMKNIELGRDTLNCYAVNSNVQRFGHPITVESATLRTDAAHTDAAAMAEVRAHAADARLPLMDWCAMEVWDVKFGAGALDGWDATADPVVMCDVSRFCASGTVVENSYFHHSVANLGRLKPSNSVLRGNTWTQVRGVIELLGLEGWLEGPMLLDNITIENNTAIGLGNNFNAKIHVSFETVHFNVYRSSPAFTFGVSGTWRCIVALGTRTQCLTLQNCVACVHPTSAGGEEYYSRDSPGKHSVWTSSAATPTAAATDAAEHCRCLLPFHLYGGVRQSADFARVGPRTMHCELSTCRATRSQPQRDLERLKIGRARQRRGNDVG